MGIELAIGALAVGTGVQALGTIKAGKEERRAARARSRIESRRNQRRTVAQVRQAQIARAQAVQGAATGGSLDTSGFRGGVSSIGSTTASNIAFDQQIQGLQQFIGQRLQDANKTRQFASVLGTASSAVAQASIAQANTGSPGAGES